MDGHTMILCRDINGDAHLVMRSELVPRTSVYGIIEDHNGRTLLVHGQSQSNERWDLPGGGVDPGESVLEALAREVKEEVDLDVTGEPQKICEFVEYFYDLYSNTGWESTRHFYKVTADGTPRIGSNGEDIAETRYFSKPLSPAKIAPVARKIVTMSENIK